MNIFTPGTDAGKRKAGRQEDVDYNGAVDYNIKG